MYYCLVIIQLISIVILTIECGYIMSKWKTKLHGLLFFCCVATLVNNVGYFFEMTAGSEDVYLASLKMSYLGRIWIPFVLFVFTLNLCGKNYKKWHIHALSAIHIAILLLVMTSDYQNLYYKGSRYVENGLFPHVTFGSGVCYIFYQYILMPAYIIFGVTFLIQNIRKEKDVLVRSRLVTLTSSIFVEIIFFVLQVFCRNSAYFCRVQGKFSRVAFFKVVFKSLKFNSGSF